MQPVDGGLLERLQALTDPRAKRGIRHRFASLLAMAACAVLSGARSFVAVGEFAAELPKAALARLGARRHLTTGRYVGPSEATLRRAIQRVDPDQLDQVLGAWLAEQASTKRGRGVGGRAVAVDGKTLRGARDAGGHKMHLFAAMVHGHGTVLAQCEVDPATNEITQFRPLLDPGPGPLPPSGLASSETDITREHPGLATASQVRRTRLVEDNRSGMPGGRVAR